jgi:hypothetical protein
MSGQLQLHCTKLMRALSQAPAEPEDLDWALETIAARRVVRITLRKIQLAGALTMWWPCACEGDARIDVTSIPDRGASQRLAASSFAEAYRTAHEQFKKRVHNQQPVELDLDEPESSAEDDDDAASDPSSGGAARLPVQASPPAQ